MTTLHPEHGYEPESEIEVRHHFDDDLDEIRRNLVTMASMVLENVQRASQRVIESILPTLDSLDAALAIEPTTEAEQRMLEGMRGTESLLLDALRTEGFDRIDALETPFDPALHEAVSVIPGEGEQVVQQELRKGYTMRGRVIRPSLVIVGHA